ncbi:hypothetical protein KQI84_01080 [bacterium]|nr:hypothetical protein [bacterium]
MRSFHDLWIELTAVLDEAIPKDERLLLSGHVGYDYRTQGVYLVEFAPNP